MFWRENKRPGSQATSLPHDDDLISSKRVVSRKPAVRFRYSGGECRTQPHSLHNPVACAAADHALHAVMPLRSA
jgi:hypothetical protein